MRKVIVNTTPLIALAGIGQLDLLRRLYSEITIPRAMKKHPDTTIPHNGLSSCSSVDI